MWGMAEKAVIKDYNAQPVPDGITDDQAAMIEPAAVALYGVDRGGIMAGSTVLVSGAGPIGALTVLAAKAAGASTWLWNASGLRPRSTPVCRRSGGRARLCRSACT
jgi:threonine dehydrogenase-like Zn-dependent dehydrogenase